MGNMNKMTESEEAINILFPLKKKYHPTRSTPGGFFDDDTLRLIMFSKVFPHYGITSLGRRKKELCQILVHFFIYPSTNEID